MRYFWYDKTLYRTPDDVWYFELYDGDGDWRFVFPSEGDLNHMRPVGGGDLKRRKGEVDRRVAVWRSKQ